jgi:hypothetical protein
MSGATKTRDPSPDRHVAKKNFGRHEFTAGFYPGFARSILVNGEEVYDQEKHGPCPFVLPHGQDKPLGSCAIELSSTKGYAFVLHVEDPDHVVDKIEITLKPKAGGGVTAFSDDGGGTPDKITVNNTALLCPPNC